MKTKIRELYNCDIEELRGYTASKEEGRLVAKAEEYYEKLEKMLDDDGKALLKNFDDSLSELCMYEREDAFVGGFSVGVKLMADVYSG